MEEANNVVILDLLYVVTVADLPLKINALRNLLLGILLTVPPRTILWLSNITKSLLSQKLLINLLIVYHVHVMLELLKLDQPKIEKKEMLKESSKLKRKLQKKLLKPLNELMIINLKIYYSFNYLFVYFLNK